jgi:2-polyprenyl-3-methyl-5-hydroxy-6-metoxy-1,4-benzoquinol methylase
MEINKTIKTIESYNKNAKKFENKFLNFKPYREKILLFQEKYLTNDNISILDIGCGPGNHSSYLYSLNHNYKITGVDLADKMLELARKNAPNCSFIKSDIRNLTSTIKYNAIIASFCIVHLSDKELVEFISQLNILLKSEGHLYLSFIEGQIDGFIKPDFFDDKIYFNFFTKEIIIKLLTDNQFKINDLYEYDYIEKNGSISKEIFIFAQKIINL